MLPTFPYMAMTITGALHIVLGLAIFITSCIGLNKRRILYEPDEFWVYQEGTNSVQKIYLGCVLASSIWILMVGILGILTGKKREQHPRTHSLKVAYMVTAILSATIFTTAGIIFCAAISVGSSYSNLKIIGSVGSICCFAEFVLSIVSSAICCCCTTTTSNTAGVVFVQVPPGNYPPGNYPPGNYPPGNYPTGNQPPAVYPPGNYPPQNYPPGTYPAGNCAPPPYSVNAPQYPAAYSGPVPAQYPTKM